MPRGLETAMILAAGRGERMRPLTDHTPKPLLPVGGKPLIVWHIEKLAAAGFRRLVINHAYMGASIERALGNGASWGVTIQYSPEGEGKALETGGGIFNAMELLGEQPFLVVNGDIWTDCDFSSLTISPGRLAHLLLVDNPEHHPNGDFVLNNDEVRAGPEGVRLTFSGIGIYHPQLFSDCHPGAFPLAPLLRTAMSHGKVSGQYFKGRWIDVGTPDRYLTLDKALGGHIG